MLALAGPASAADANIRASLGATGGDFTTKRVTIPRGGRVTFQNLDLVAHNVTGTKLRKRRPVFRSGDVRFGGKAQVAGVSSLKRGAYGYICSIHPATMKGTLHVR